MCEREGARVCKLHVSGLIVSTELRSSWLSNVDIHCFLLLWLSSVFDIIETNDFMIRETFPKSLQMAND